MIAIQKIMKKNKKKQLHDNEKKNVLTGTLHKFYIIMTKVKEKNIYLDVSRSSKRVFHNYYDRISS